MWFKIIHGALLIPFTAVGMAVGTAFGPVLGAIDGIQAWHKVKQAHDEMVELDKYVEEMQRQQQQLKEQQQNTATPNS